MMNASASAALREAHQSRHMLQCFGECQDRVHADNTMLAVGASGLSRTHATSLPRDVSSHSLNSLTLDAVLCVKVLSDLILHL